MKIYTYYEPLNNKPGNIHTFNHQEELLNLWRESWNKAGFEPCVVSLKDAQKSPLFETLSDKMTYFFNQITGKTLSAYGLHCFLRWLAYSTIGNSDELILVSDYDVFNNGSKQNDWNFNYSYLTLFQGCCPSIASGAPRHFEALCKAFDEITEERLSFLIENASHYHDQDFFRFNFTQDHNKDYKSLCLKYNIDITNQHVQTYRGTDLPTKAWHIPHSAARFNLKLLPEYEHLDCADSIRVAAAKKILSNAYIP